MSQRPAALRPLRGALALLLAGSLLLAACGRDDAGSDAGADASTPVASTPQAPTTPTTPPETPPQERDDEGGEKSERGGDTKAPSGGASLDPEAEPDPGSPEDRARDALVKAGFEVEPFAATGNAERSLKVDEDAVVAFYPSAGAAREEAAAFETAFESESPIYGEVETRGDVLYMVTKSKKLTGADRSRFRKMMSAVEATR